MVSQDTIVEIVDGSTILNINTFNQKTGMPNLFGAPAFFIFMNVEIFIYTLFYLYIRVHTNSNYKLISIRFHHVRIRQSLKLTSTLTCHL